jgi:hypothetical protein
MRLGRRLAGWNRFLLRLNTEMEIDFCECVLKGLVVRCSWCFFSLFVIFFALRSRL